MLLLIFFFKLINSEIQFDFDPGLLLNSYINAIQNQEFENILADGFAVYDCEGKVLSGSDFNIEKLKKLMNGLNEIPTHNYKILHFHKNETHFNVEVGYFVSEFELVYIEPEGDENEECESKQKNCGWRIKSEKRKHCLAQNRPYHSSLLIDYELIFEKPSKSLLEKYIKNLETGKFPKLEKFKITKVSNDTIDLTTLNPIIKFIQKVPTIPQKQIFITSTSEANLILLIAVDKTNIIELGVIYNENEEFEIISEKHRGYSNDDSEIVAWYTSAFIDYRKIYLKIVEKLMEKFENAIRTKTLEDEIFSIKNINISELGYYTTFLNYQYIYIYGGDEERQQFSILNYDEKLTQYSFTIENNKFNLISNLNWNSIDYIELIYSDKTESMMSEYKETLLTDEIEFKNIFNENFKLYTCDHGSLNITQFEKELEKPGNIVDFDNYEDYIEFVSVNSTNGDIDFMRNQKSRFLAKYNFDLKKYKLSLEYRCQDDDFFNISYSKGWENAKNNVGIGNRKEFKLEEPLITFGKGWMFDYKPTIIPYKNFNATSDAIEVEKALESNEESKLIEIICHRSQLQRQQIAEEYQQIYQKDLITKLKAHLSGELQLLIVSLILRPVDVDVTAIHADYDVRERYFGAWLLLDVLTTRTNKEIEEIKDEYELKHGKTHAFSGKDRVSQDSNFNYKSEIRGTFAEFAEVRRDESLVINKTKALVDAIRLDEAAKTMKLSDNEITNEEKVFLEIFTRTNLIQLKLIFKKYYEYSGKTIRQLLSSMNRKESWKHSYEIILDITQDRIGYFVDVLKDSMSGYGTNNQKLIYYIVTRSERDLESIRQEFDRRNPEESLIEWIVDDTSGTFQDALLALVRGNKKQ